MNNNIATLLAAAHTAFAATNTVTAQKGRTGSYTNPTKPTFNKPRQRAKTKAARKANRLMRSKR